MRISVEGKYIVDTNNKEEILKLARIYMNRGFHYILIDSKSGGWDDKPFPNEYVFNSKMYRRGYQECVYSTVNTPYGKYANSELSAYRTANMLFDIFVEMENEVIECNAVTVGSVDGLLELPNSVKEPEPNNDYPYSEKAKELLKSIGIDTDGMEKEELHMIYFDCLHDFTKTGNFDKDAARHRLIDMGKLDNERSKYEYMRDEYPVLTKYTINEAKEQFENK